MPPVRDYYEILGVSANATQEEIKKSFRTLVRKYHPDVHPDKALAERMFKQIHEAYRTLSDEDKRKVYDITRTKKSTDHSAPRVKPQPSGWYVQGNKPPGGTAARQKSAPSGSSYVKPESPEVKAAVNNAQFAFIRGRLGESERLCKEALKQHGNHSRLHVILGDIYKARRMPSEALDQYGLAVQFAPGDMEILEKFERLAANMGIKAVPGQPVPVRGRAGIVFAFMGWMAFLLITFFWLPYIRSLDPLIAAGSGFTLRGWGWEISIALAIQGFLLGSLLRAGKLFGHYDDELIFQTIREGMSRPLTAPIGLLLIGLSAIFFWAAAVIYLIMSWIQENESRSLRAAFLIVAAYVPVVALANPSLAVPIMWIGGNIVFVFLLIGWWTADLFQVSGSRK